ncbi:MAG TPA: histidine kinase dimerization/phosphoacceptor domain -containing protein, partial [Bacteroidia bacterium]|nr:histidine kinase dimerization/phosphoacceptor domain -containing protein [Bacteroidia bacterium]
MEETIDLLEEIDSVSKIHTLKRGDIDALMIEFAKRILSVLRIERISVWLLDKKGLAIISMGEYDLPNREFKKGSILLKSKYPHYFKAISENEIVLIENVHSNTKTKELWEDYSQPNNLISLMDIPLRLEGKLIGIMCFEKKGNVERVFSRDDQVFALSASTVFTSSLEARYRRAAQQKLDHELREKDLLVKEIHHRIKNNLAVVLSLMNLQSGKTKDAFHKALFDECRNKISSIAEVHSMMYKSKSYTRINMIE